METDHVGSNEWNAIAERLSISVSSDNYHAQLSELRGAYKTKSDFRLIEPTEGLIHMLLSQQVLGKDWNSAAEDAAWQNL
jgi:hypothetical protein